MYRIISGMSIRGHVPIKACIGKEDMERLMKDIPKQLHSGNRELQRARGFFILMFLLRGMPFVDLAYLKNMI